MRTLLLLALVAFAATPAETDALAKADAAAMRLGGTLKSRVLEELGKGPSVAASVCSEDAPKLAAQIQAETGVTLGRSSLRLRNPKNAGPPWVQEWLRAQGERPAAGLTPVSTVVDGKARVLKPIAIEAPCLNCHGDRATLAPDLAAELARRYPTDAATGYALGDLRGVLWGEAPVGP